MPLVRYSDAYLSDLVENARSSDPHALADVCAIVKRTCKPRILRALGPQHYEDVLQDVTCIVIDALQKGITRDPLRFIGYILQIREWQIIAHWRKAVRDRHFMYSLTDMPVFIEETYHFQDRRCYFNPHKALEQRQQSDALGHALLKLNARDQEVLTRFYILDQSKEQVQECMSISDRKFALLKSRALGKLRLKVERELAGSRETLGRLALAV